MTIGEELANISQQYYCKKKNYTHLGYNRHFGFKIIFILEFSDNSV